MVYISYYWDHWFLSLTYVVINAYNISINVALKNLEEIVKKRKVFLILIVVFSVIYNNVVDSACENGRNLPYLLKFVKNEKLHSKDTSTID